MTYQRLLQWISMTTTVICTLWFYTATLDPFNITKLAVLVVGAAALIGALAGTWKAWWSKTELLLVGAVGLFLLGLTAAGLASDQNLYRTLWGAWARNDGWMAYASLALILLAVALGFRGAQTRHGLYVLVGVGAIEIVYSTLQTFGHDPVKWNNGYNAIIGTVGNPNFASALLGVAGVAMCWLALESSHHFAMRIFAGVLALAAVWLTIRSDSIQGTLAFAAGLAVLLGGWLSMKERRPQLRALLWPYVGLVLISGLLGVLGLAGTGPLARFLDTQNFANRKFYWKTGWHMFTANPVFGVGLDSLGDHYRTFRALDSTGMPGVEVSTNAAHSIIFQMLGTGGLAFAGPFLLIQLLVVWRAIVALRSGERRLLVTALIGAWFAFALQSLFSIDQLGLTVWGWVLSGLLIGVSFEAPFSTAKSKRRGKQQAAQSGLVAGSVAGIVLALLASLAVADPLSDDRDVAVAMSYSVDNTQATQVAAAKQAVLDVANRIDDPYMAAQLVGKLYQIGAVDDGIALAQASVVKSPLDMQLWNLIAIAYEQTGRASQAVEARQRTLDLDPLNTEFQTLLKQDQAAK